MTSAARAALARLELLVREAVRANVRVSVGQLRHGSEVLERPIESEGLRVVGAEYSLDSGLVRFLDCDPTERAWME